MNEQDVSYLWDRRHGLLYRVQLSVLYHQKRERYFDACDKIAKAIAIIGGSAALSRMGGPDLILYVAAVITITSTLSLVFGFSDRSKRHSELARSFRQLEAEICGKGERDFTEADLNAWTAKERTLEGSEPPALGALVILCQNELAMAQGQQDKIVRISWLRRTLAHVLDIPPPHHPA